MTSTITNTASPTYVDPPRAASLPARWMVCTAGFLSAPDGAAAGRQPLGTRHARAMGSLTTRCGRHAANWVNFYTRAFEVSHPEACPQCRDLMAADRFGR